MDNLTTKEWETLTRIVAITHGRRCLYIGFWLGLLSGWVLGCLAMILVGAVY